MSTEVTGRIAAWAGFIVRPDPRAVTEAARGSGSSPAPRLGLPWQPSAPGDSHDTRGAETEAVA